MKMWFQLVPIDGIRLTLKLSEFFANYVKIITDIWDVKLNTGRETVGL